MAYEEPGVKVILELAAAGVVIQTPAQATALVGPLYEVFEEELAASKYDASTGAGAQAFVWPSKKASSVVDLHGIREDTAEPDDQLLESAEYPMVVKLRDPVTLVESTVNLVTDVSAVSQTGFTVAEGSSAGSAKASGADVSSAEEGKFYRAAGGFINDGLAIGDRVRLTNGVFDVNGEVTAFTDSEITYDTGVAPVVDTTAITGADGDAQTTSGQLVSAAGGFTAAVNVGDRVVIWNELSEFDDANGTTALTVTTAGGHGLVPDVVAGDSDDVGRRITIHSANVADGNKNAADAVTAGTTALSSATVTFVAGDVGKIVRLSGGTAALPNTYRRIVAFTDGNNVTMDATVAAGTGATIDVLAPLVRTIDTIVDANTLTYTGGDVADASQVDIPVIVHDAVRRDVTVVNDDNTLTYSGTGIVSGLTYLLNLPFDVYNADLTYEVFPDYDVLLDFRALDVSNVDDTIAVTSPSDVTTLGDTSKANPLLFAATQALAAMGTTDVPILLLPVDLWSEQISGSKSGLPGDSNETLAHSLALEVLSAEETAYYLNPLTRSPAIRDSYEAHVDAMSVPEEKKERITYLTYDLPLGEFESSTGSIEPGLDGGNKQINDAGQNFISDHGILPGKVVTILTPSAYAGDYEVGTGTTDDILELLGANWTITPEMAVADGDFDAVSGEVSTATADAWKDADVGDWIVRGSDYRQITAKTSTTLLVYGGGALTGVSQAVSIIRSAQAVKYYVDPLTKTEQAEALRDISLARANFRVVHLWPDETKFVTGQDQQGNDVEEFLPSYYASAAEAGRDSVLRPERASTGEALAGPTGVKNSNKYFGRSGLNTIAGGGWAILEQPASLGPVVMRHLLSTDMSSVKRQEVSVTKNVDNMAKVMRASLEPNLNDDEGRVNITQPFLNALMVPIEGIMANFENNRQVVTGPNNEQPFKILELDVDPVNIDQINVRVDMTVPIPGNRIEVTFVI